MKLSQQQSERYSRQLPLEGFGSAGQNRLLKSSVLVVGAGGLGSPASLYLAGAGMGQIGIVDDDSVSLNNLHRQILHGMNDLGRPKSESAFNALKRVNPDIRIDAHRVRFTAANGRKLVDRYDFILDCTDNFETKFLIADLCAATGKAYSHAGIRGYFGQTMTVIPGESACYRCVFDLPPPEGTVPAPASSGVLGPVPGVIGSVQAAEAIKYILDAGELLTNRLFCYDAFNSSVRIVDVSMNPHCRCCRRTSDAKVGTRIGKELRKTIIAR